VTAELLQTIASELALFASAGFLLFALDDLAVDLIYFVRRGWRSARVYRHHSRADVPSLRSPAQPGWLVVFIPAWDEAAVIGKMLRATLERTAHPNFTLMVGCYRNDPATAAAIASVADPRVHIVTVKREGPTTKSDCLNQLYAALVRLETERGERAKAIVLHDAEDLVHPFELAVFDSLIEARPWSSCPLPPSPIRAEAGSPAIIVTSSPRAMARSWSCARRSAPRSRLQGLAARSAAMPCRS
jgi:adsorption protein B